MAVPIFILCHWHTASSPISRVFNKCGMFVGNNQTTWDSTCDVNCEHSLMNNTMSDIYHHGVTEKRLRRIEEILVSYEKEANRLNIPFYGIKITHALQTWDYVGHIFEEQCPDAKYVIGIRNPVQIINTTNRQPHHNEWPDERIIKSWMSVEKAIDKLVKDGAFLIDYPSSWEHDFKGVKKVIKEIGMEWNLCANNVFDFKRVKKIYKKDVLSLIKKSKESIRMYSKFCKLSSR